MKTLNRLTTMIKAKDAVLVLALIMAAAMLISSCSKDEDNDKTIKYELNTATSTAEWIGRLRGDYFNKGTIDVKSEELVVENGQITKGRFKMPLISLKNTNLPDDRKPLLIHHLQSDDFFNMVANPNAYFTITSIDEYVTNGQPAVAGANTQVTGQLTMVGETREITFPAKITVTDQNIAVDAIFSFDRRKWGINFATDPKLPDTEYILPMVDMTLTLKANRK